MVDRQSLDAIGSFRTLLFSVVASVVTAFGWFLTRREVVDERRESSHANERGQVPCRGLDRAASFRRHSRPTGVHRGAGLAAGLGVDRS